MGSEKYINERLTKELLHSNDNTQAELKKQRRMMIVFGVLCFVLYRSIKNNNRLINDLTKDIEELNLKGD